MTTVTFASLLNSAGLAGEIALKSALLLITAWILQSLLGKRRPLLVSVIWNACLVALVILPFSTLLPPVSVDYVADVQPAVAIEPEPLQEQSLEAEPPSLTGPMKPSASPVDAVGPVVELTPASQAPAATPRHASGPTLWICLWLGGVLLTGTRLLFMVWSLRRMLESAETIQTGAWTATLQRWQNQLGLQRLVRICHTSSARIPFTCGVWRPAIVVPSELVETATSDERDVILLHELTHVARRDCAWQWLLLVLQTVYWWQPLIWLAGRSMNRVRERICDSYCVGTLENRDQYTDGLLRIAANLVRPVRLGVGLAMVRIPLISRRLQEIDSTPVLKRFRSTGPVSALMFVGVLITAGVIGAGIIDAQAASSQNPVTDLHGDALPPGTIARLGTIRLKHGGRVTGLRYSSDGTILTSRSKSGLYVWDAASGQRLRHHDLDGAFTLRVSDDTVMIGRDENEVLQPWKFTDPDSNPPIITPEESDNEGGAGFIVQDVAAVQEDNEQLDHFTMSPDGRTLATATRGALSKPRKVQFWHFEPGKKLTELTPTGVEWTTPSAVEELIFNSDGQRLLVMTEEHGERTSDVSPPPEDTDIAPGQVRIMVCDVGDPAHVETSTVPAPVQMNVRGIAFAPSGRQFAIGTKDHRVLIYNAGDTTPSCQIEIPPAADDRQPATVLAFSPDGTQLAGSGRSRRIWIWDVNSGDLLMECAGHHSWVEQLDYAPNGQTLASGAQDGAIHLWDVASGLRKDAESGHEYWVFGASLSADGRLAATCGGDGTIRLWDTDTGRQQQVFRIEGHKWTTSCALSPDGTHLAATSPGRTVLYDIQAGEIVRDYASPQKQRGGWGSVTFSADGRRMAAITDTKTAVVWEPFGKGETARFVIEIPEDEVDQSDRNRIRRAHAACLSPDGSRLAVASRTRMAASAIVQVWDIESRQLIRTLTPEKGGASQLQFAPNGRWLVTAGHSSRRGFVADREISSPNYEDSLILWGLSGGRVIKKYGIPRPEDHHVRIPNGVTFTPDGKYLVTAERDGTVLVFSVATGRQMAQLKGHTGTVNGIAVSGDGKRLLSVSQDHTGLVWDFEAVLKGPQEIQ